MQKREAKSYSINKGVAKQFNEFCKENCICDSQLVEKLIKEHLKKNGRKKE